jgi:hypothetical protein
MHINTRGVTLMDTLVGMSLMVIMVTGVAATFQLSVDVVTNSKARSAAVGLASQRLEYIRSIPYASIGMQHGIPSGIIPETESAVANGIIFTRTTYIEYVDDPADGLGVSDTNNIEEDYKAVRVEVAWNFHGRIRSVVLATRVSPPGIESNVIGGVLSFLVTTSGGTPLQGVPIEVINNSLTPTIDETLITDASGAAQILGAPTSTAYQIIVTQPGYSKSQTYPVTAQNTSPTPQNLTVTNNNITAITLAIDMVGRKDVYTWNPIQATTWVDTFSNASQLASQASTTISSGNLTLSGTELMGTAQSVAFGTTTIASWGTLSISRLLPASTTILYQIYDQTGTTLIPDTQIPNNSIGFASTTVDISHISTSTYPLISLKATLSTLNGTKPSIDSWTVSYTYGPLPLGSIPLYIKGAKSIGTGPGGTVYKYTTSTSTSALGTISIPNLEWDSYTIAASTTSSYDISSICSAQPEALAPGSINRTDVYMVPHTNNSLLITVRLLSSGALLPGANVSVTTGGTSLWSTTDACGQAFFPSLSNSTYSVSAGIVGHATTTVTGITVGSRTQSSVIIN